MSINYVCDICKNACKDKAYLVKIDEINLDTSEYYPHGQSKFVKHVILCADCYEASNNNLTEEQFNPYAGPLAMHD